MYDYQIAYHWSYSNTLCVCIFEVENESVTDEPAKDASRINWTTTRNATKSHGHSTSGLSAERLKYYHPDGW